MLWTVRVSLLRNRLVDCSSNGWGVLGVGMGVCLIDLWMRVMSPPPVSVRRS